jgi:uncharacterized protein
LQRPVEAFDDRYQVYRVDWKVEGELRWQTIGMVRGIQLLLVAYTVNELEGEESIHVISARKATPQERRIYAQSD